MTPQSINRTFVVEQLEEVSCSEERMMVVGLDNVRVHKSKAVQEQRQVWELRRLRAALANSSFRFARNIISHDWSALPSRRTRDSPYCV
jgi:hypothetical protein